MTTIKRFRQLLFSINYILIHKGNEDHQDFFELFRQYNVEVLDVLVNNLEVRRFSSKNTQLVKAVYNMATELLNMDIFNQILNANMLSYYGLADEYSVKGKDSMSKFSTQAKKISLEEDWRAQENTKYFNVFKVKPDKSKKKHLRDTKIFTEPKLNYGAQMQLAEYYTKIFYLKGGFSQYSTYEDLIEDQLIDISDSDSDDFLPEERIPKNEERNRFTFSKHHSGTYKR